MDFDHFWVATGSPEGTLWATWGIHFEDIFEPRTGYGKKRLPGLPKVTFWGRFWYLFGSILDGISHDFSQFRHCSHTMCHIDFDMIINSFM